jgi:CheY-like chemotaxis protein
LAQVYGFMHQSGGSVRIDTAEGKGTTVELLFPRHTTNVAQAETAPADAVGGFRAAGRRALVVEDQQGVREYVVETLRDFGFEVLAAPDAAAALATLEADNRIDLLMTDIGLPGGLDGWGLAAEARKTIPGVKIVLMTGYAQSNLEPLGADSELLMKPFMRAALESRLLRLFAK